PAFSIDLYMLSLHDALPISRLLVDEVLALPVAERAAADRDLGVLDRQHPAIVEHREGDLRHAERFPVRGAREDDVLQGVAAKVRSEEHTSELQSRFDLVCRL